MPVTDAYQTALSSKLIYKPKYNFLGLDLSLTSTGMVYMTGDGMIDSFAIKTKPENGSTTHRISYIKDYILDKISTFARIEDVPVLVGLEGYAMGIRGGRSFTIGELGGVVKEALRVRGMNTLIVPPNCLKKFATGKGSGDKDVIRLALYKQYGVEFPTHDEVDACYLALMAYSYHSRENSDGVFTMPQYQEESLDKCEFLKLERNRCR